MVIPNCYRCCDCGAIFDIKWKFKGAPVRCSECGSENNDPWYDEEYERWQKAYYEDDRADAERDDVGYAF